LKPPWQGEVVRSTGEVFLIRREAAHKKVSPFRAAKTQKAAAKRRMLLRGGGFFPPDAY
jgi:hypothetical protein